MSVLDGLVNVSCEFVWGTTLFLVQVVRAPVRAMALSGNTVARLPTGKKSIKIVTGSETHGISRLACCTSDMR